MIDINFIQELKPCPFCGGVAAVNNKIDRAGYTFYAFCSNCLAQSDFQSSFYEAIKTWNIRTDTTNIR